MATQIEALFACLYDVTFHLILTLSPVIAIVPIKASSSTGGFDPAIIVALISLSGVLVSLLINVLQNRHNTRLEQRRHEERLQQEREREAERIQHEQKILLLQQELSRQIQREEREQQRRKEIDENARIAMLLAKTREERVTAYRQAFRSDPRIASLQILDMSRPLDVEGVYVRLRLHQEVRLSYQLDPDLQAAEQKHDPNLLLKVGQLQLEKRAAATILPEEALRTYKRCMITGDPGAGKSTLLKYLALCSINGKLATIPDLPIHIELHAFAGSSHRDLLEFAAALWDDRYGFPKTEALDYLHSILHNGQALLLLDALDETVSGSSREEAEESYRKVSESITRVSIRYPHAPILVTARKADYHQRPPLAGFTELEVLDFRKEDVAQFIRRWFSYYADERRRHSALELIRKLERNPRIEALAANPLLLSLIVIVYEAQLDLPKKRSELYKQCIDVLLKEWDSKRDIRRRRVFPPENKHLLLEEVAWHFHQQGQRYFHESELLEVMATFLPAIEIPAEQNSRILNEIAAESGLLKEQAHGWYGFLHLTLQEYFVALYAADHQQLTYLLTKRDDPWWEEALLLYAEHIPDASLLLEHLVSPKQREIYQEDLFHTDLILAGRCLAASKIIRQASLRQEIIERLFAVLKTSRYSLVAEQISAVLVENGSEPIYERLIDLLFDKNLDSTIHGNVIRALGQSGDRSITWKLVSLLADEHLDPSIRESIASALGQLGDHSIASKLVTLLANMRLAPSIRWGIANVLGQLGDRSIAPELVALLVDEHVDPWVCESIALALGQLGDRSIATQLVNLLGTGRLYSSVSEKVASALGQLGEHSIAVQLVNLLADEHLESSIRKSIALALGQLGDRSITPQLISLLADERLESSVRGSIALALGQLGDRSVAVQLVNLLADEHLDSSLRGSIALALGQLGDRSVTPQLISLLADEHLDSRIHASIALALGQLGDRSVTPQLISLLADEHLDSWIRKNIALALGQLGDRSVAAQLVNLLADERLDSWIRKNIALALGQLGDHSVAAQLVNLLADERLDSWVCEDIALTLGQLGEREEDLRALAALLSTSNIAESIYRALWMISRRLGFRIYVANGPKGTQVAITKVSADSQ